TSQTIQVGQTLTFNVSATDPDGNTVTLSASNLPANSSFSPNPATGTPTAIGTFNFTPSAGQANQTFNVNFTASDNNGCSGGVPVPITVQIIVTPGPPPPNNCPVVTVSGGTSQTIQVGQTLTFNVSATDPDGNTVTLQASNLPANSSFSPNPATGTPTASGTFSFTPLAVQVNQTFNVNFTASDNNGCSGGEPVPVTVQLIVIPGSPLPNNCPIITVSGGTSQTVEMGQKLTFTVIATDPDGDTVTLQASNLPPNASFTPNPATGTPTASGTFSFMPSQGQVDQSFNVTFIASDNNGCNGAAGASMAVSIAVSQVEIPNPCGNHAPMISVPSLPVVGVGQTLSFMVKAVDQDGDDVTLFADYLPPGASFNPVSGRFDFSPTLEQLGQAQLGQGVVAVFAAVDSKGARSTAIVDITPVTSIVSPALPLLSLPPGPIMVKGADTLTFAVAGLSQTSGCPVTLSGSGLPAAGTFNPSTNTFDMPATEDMVDKSFLVNFTATDCAGRTRTASVRIIVINSTSDCVAVGQGRIDVVAKKKLIFNDTGVNDHSGAVSISVTNRGGGLLTISSINLSDERNYRLEGGSGVPLTLQSGGVIELKVFFEPRSSGAHSSTLTILSSDPDKPVFTVNLKGKGVNK
ncbi:MAG: hypothetical protein L0229_03030, partial [Blastocatellia bacterium]|nr:hypothetical protein [Blastocatellia bacterium]